MEDIRKIDPDLRTFININTPEDMDRIITMYTKNYSALELKGGVSHEKIHTVAVENTIELFINKIPIASILATPEMLKELAIGYLICEGLVKGPDSIKDFKIDGNRIYAAIDETEHH